MSSVASSQQKLKMENLQTSYEWKVWTDDFIIPKTINLKSINNNNPFTTPFFLIELRVQEFLQYLLEKGNSIVEEPRGPFTVKSFYLPSNSVVHDDAADDSIGEILSSVGMRLNSSMLPIMRDVSSFARTIMSHPANLGRPLLPIVLGIVITSWDPRDAAIAYGENLVGDRRLRRKSPWLNAKELKMNADRGLSYTLYRYKVQGA